MKRHLFFIFVLIISASTHAFDIIVFDTKIETGSVIIDNDVFSNKAYRMGLFPNTFYPGSAGFLNLWGLSSSHTLIVLNGMELNSASFGGYDLGGIADYMIDDIYYHNLDISSSMGSTGIGGLLAITNRVKDRFLLHLYGDTFLNYGINTVLPLRTNNLRINLLFNVKGGVGYIDNSDHKRFHYGASMNISEKIFMIYSNSREDLGTPGPVMTEDIRRRADEAITVLYPYNRQSGNGDLFILSYRPGRMSLSLSYIRKWTDYMFYIWDTPFISSISDEQYKFSLSDKFATGNYIASFRFNYTLARYEHKNYGLNDISFAFFNIMKGFGSTIKMNYSGSSPYFSGNVHLHRPMGIFEIFTSLAAGMREPTLTDKYFPGSGNANLRPERSLSFNASIAYGRSLTFFFSHRDVHDMIVWVLKDGAEYLYGPENVNRTILNNISVRSEKEFLGFDIFARADINWGHREVFSVYHDGKPKTVTHPAYYVPPFVFYLKISRQLGIMDINLDYIYRAVMKNLYWGYIEKDLAALNNVNLSVKLGRHFTFGIRNILNFTGSINFGDTPFDHDYPLMPRNFYIRIGI